jgi:uncharacterized protein with FMN-binding domain
MKKVVLSTFTIISFLIYGLYQKSTGSSNQNRPTSTPYFTGNAAMGTAPQDNSINTYKDGIYTGSAIDAFYGYVQVRVTVNNGQISDVAFLQYPNDRQNSMMINMYAMPILKQEVIQSQSTNVDIVSGATATCQAFIKSLDSALSKAI